MTMSRRALTTALAASAATTLIPLPAEAATRSATLRWRKSTPTRTKTIQTTLSVATVTAPAAARDAGFARLAFSDDFDSSASIDLTSRGARGFKWYPAGVHAWGQKDTPPSDLRVEGSALTITPSATNFNWNIATADPNTGAGQTFGHGYFEARMRFPVQPAPAPMTSDGRFAWPAFWAESQAHVLGTRGTSGWGELDFFEACMGAQDFVGTVHDWPSSKGGLHVQNANNTSATTADFTEWHIFGCLWKPGQASWYLDGILKHTQTWSAQGAKPLPYDLDRKPHADAFQVMDIEPGRGGMNVVLGSGRGRPMSIDWVRVWAR